MTDQNTDQTAQEATESDLPAEDAQSAPEATETTEDATEAEGRKGNPEAAKWRTKYRDAETQVSALTQRVADLQRAEVVRLATGAGLLIDGDDVFRDRELSDLLHDNGDVDTDLVAAAVTSVRESKPHLAKPYLNGDVGIRTEGGTKPLSWSDVLAT